MTTQKRVIKFRKFKPVMKGDNWSVPCIEEMFDHLRCSGVFTRLAFFNVIGELRLMKHVRKFQYSYVSLELDSAKLCHVN